LSSVQGTATKNSTSFTNAGVTSAMSVLVPWPATCPTGAGSTFGNFDVAPDFVSKRLDSMCDVTYILQAIKSELKGIQPLKDRVRKDLMQALVQSSSKSLCGCRLEVVGSSSWGGDVPHSDLDMVLVTPSGTASGSDAIAALRDLRTSVEELFWWTPCDGWHRLDTLQRRPSLRCLSGSASLAGAPQSVKEVVD
jgi:hypothetical protein